MNRKLTEFCCVLASISVYVEPPLIRAFVQGQLNQTINCYGNGHPKPTIQWFYNGSPIPKVEHVYPNHTSDVVQVTWSSATDKLKNVSSLLYLRADGITLKDAGNYTCKAWNGVSGQAEETVEILCKLFGLQKNHSVFLA